MKRSGSISLTNYCQANSKSISFLNDFTTEPGILSQVFKVKIAEIRSFSEF